MKSQIEFNFKGTLRSFQKSEKLGAVYEASRAIELDPYNGAAYYLRGYNRFDLQVKELRRNSLPTGLSRKYHGFIFLPFTTLSL